MQPVDRYLRLIEVNLRCPVERRAEVIKELQGHLTDRVDALIRQCVEQTAAERQAVREMGPAWLLALKLSAANGWNVMAHVLRELWAMGIGVLMVMGFSGLRSACFGNYMPSGYTHCPIALDLRNGFIPMLSLMGSRIALMVPLFVFGYALGRVVRGWTWAIIPAILLAWRHEASPASFSNLSCAQVLLPSALIFFVSALVGCRKERSNLAWLAWAMPIVMLAISMGSRIANEATADILAAEGYSPGALSAIRYYLSDSFSGPDSEMFRMLLITPWLFWLAAKALQKAGKIRARTAE
jgi:hypothetical protein